MNIPLPHHLFRQVIRMRHTEYTVTRVDFSRGARGSNTSGVAEEFGQLLWIFRPGEADVQNEFGVRLTGDIHALAIPSEHARSFSPSDSVEAFKMEENTDRIQHGGETYSVKTIEHLPNHDNKQITLIHFDKMENVQ